MTRVRAAATIVLVSSVMALGLFAGDGAPDTWAGYSSTRTAGAVFAVAAPPCVAWAAEDVLVEGSRNAFHGCVHADRDAEVMGSRDVFHGRLEYVRGFRTNGADHVFAGSVWQVLPAGEPDIVRVEAYRPDGGLAAAAGSAYHAHEGDALLTQESPPGIHYVPGNAHVVLSPGSVLRATVVAEGDVTVVGNRGALEAYADNVALAAGGAGPSAVLVAGSGNAVEGRVAAPLGHVHVAGHENEFKERVGARVLKVTGMDNSFGRP